MIVLLKERTSISNGSRKLYIFALKFHCTIKRTIKFFHSQRPGNLSEPLAAYLPLQYICTILKMEKFYSKAEMN